MDYLQVLLELSKTVENTKAAHSKAKWRVTSGEWRDREKFRSAIRDESLARGEPNTRSRKPVLREIAMQEKWRRGNGNVGVAKATKTI